MSYYDMIFWARPKDIGIERMADIAYGILKCLANYGDELSPNYLTASKKSLIKEFVLDRDSTKFQLERKVDRESLRLFNEFRSGISFFSSMDGDKSSKISIRLGSSKMGFPQTCIVDLPHDFSGLGARRTDFVGLIKQLIQVFEPYYGFVLTGNNIPSGTRYWGNDKPTYTHWINYYDAFTAEAVGGKVVQSLDGVERLGSGYLFMLQDEPLDVDNPQHMQRQREMNELLGLVGAQAAV